MLSNKVKTTWIVIILLAIALVGYAKYAPGKYDDFANCVTKADATFYGAFWCPHCADEKKAFGSSMKNILYVECSTPDGKGQTEICKQMNVSSYPTWIFADGSRETGFVSLAKIGEKTGCKLP